MKAKKIDAEIRKWKNTGNEIEAMKKKTDIGIFYSIKKKIQHLSKADNRRDRT